MDVGIALPEWIFPKDKKVAPLLLLALVGFGILLPLVAVSWHMLSSNRFTGPNGVMQETLAFYFHSKYSVKESQVRGCCCAQASRVFVKRKCESGYAYRADVLCVWVNAHMWVHMLQSAAWQT